MAVGHPARELLGLARLNGTGWAELRNGDWQAAREPLEEAQAILPALTHALPWCSVQALLELARGHLARLDMATAASLLARAEAILERRPALGVLVSQTEALRDELHALPESVYEGAIHCVTTWSKFDMTWRGVSVDTLLEAVGPQASAQYAVVLCHTAYTTNLPLTDLTGGKAWVAWEADGEPLDRQHGGPARLLVPHLYFWKSAKFVAGLQLIDHDEPGFWERNGYHDRGDPWLEQRYQGD